MTLDACLPLVGGDRFLHPDECGVPDAIRALLAPAWDLYADRFDGFTGARLDPQFARLALPPLDDVVPVLGGGTVAIVGTGPSLGASIPLVRRLRGRVSVWTSIRGAEALASHGITPDLAILQHGSDLDAYLTARHLRDRDGRHPLAEVPLVLVEPRTPAALLAGLDPARLGLVDGAVGWGLWPATLAALAAASGAATVTLVGIDLGTADRIDPVHEPLAGLLSLIAECSPRRVSFVDAGNGARKRGWAPALLSAAAAASHTSRIDVQRARTSDADDRWAGFFAHLETLAPLVSRSVEARARALSARDHGARTSDRALADDWHALRAWGHDTGVRTALQEGLGACLLPTLWRHAPPEPAGPIWRPVLLATDEIVRLAATAHRLVETRGRKGAAA